MPARTCSQFRHHEEPEEHLDQQRDVAEELDIGAGDGAHDRMVDGPGDPDDRAKGKGNDPCRERHQNRPDQTGDDPIEIGLLAIRLTEQYLPVPIVAHAAYLKR
jgi:hypothetical protein